MHKKFCKDCGLPKTHHIEVWLEELTNFLSFDIHISKKLDTGLEVFLEKVLGFFGIITRHENFELSDIQARSACFIKEARKRGVKFNVLKSPFGYMSHFSAEVSGKKVRFEGLPIAEHFSKKDVSSVNCKEKTKKELKNGNFPIANGRSFWFFQKSKALKFGINDIGFPLVVKPRGGSVARHVITNINSKKDLQNAIKNVIKYSPTFIIEKFIEKSFVYRGTVIDFKNIAVVKQIPANVVGDGVLTIQELIDNKNNDECRFDQSQKEANLYKLVINDTTKYLLEKNNYNLQTIPDNGEIIYLQKNPFVKLGGDIIEVSNKVHKDNVKLFIDIAKHFDIRVVGIDLMIPDITSSWKSQNCGILELNNLPSIEMHHFPSMGEPQNVAKSLVNLFFKYYV